MLESLDVLIGLVVVLLALSMAVTVITQALTSIVNSRGSHLRQGLTDLLQQLDETLGPEHSRAIAGAVLRHPLVSGSSVVGTSARRLGNVIHREEFTKLLMAFAAGARGTSLKPDVVAALNTALANNGIGDPNAKLAQIRMLALQLEQKSPELSHATRQTLAVLQAAPSDLVAKINGWFDQSMDRTSQRFTASTRAVTFVAAFLVAFGLQVDTPALVNRLAADPELVAALVERAKSVPPPESNTPASEGSTAASPPDAKDAGTDATTPSDPAETATAPATGSADEPGAPAAGQPSTGEGATGAPKETPASAARAWSRQTLDVAGIVSLPSSFEDWQRGYSMSSILGMLITALLLSLGAPFWYSALGKLLQLRSVLAAKDDTQRQERQSTTASDSITTTNVT
ncbi:hypothetical protein LuPra_00984 [Luteitalea pratensis]|uniref:Uncharacterized protein n=1 Tax=Luteitalea pratensis TaxID=1855912 RepID=A0A143PHS5_LUTPR|nr:hypothetical protein [Luteitalea pratensis]AMY07803.1 hypothetical protein LuPra_00984 [Luteitalea pratensis]